MRVDDFMNRMETALAAGGAPWWRWARGPADLRLAFGIPPDGARTGVVTVSARADGTLPDAAARHALELVTARLAALLDEGPKPDLREWRRHWMAAAELAALEMGVADWEWLDAGTIAVLACRLRDGSRTALCPIPIAVPSDPPEQPSWVAEMIASGVRATLRTAMAALRRGGGTQRPCGT